VLLDGPLRHLDAELQELAANPFGAPETVLVGEPSDQLDGFRRDARRRGLGRPGSRSPEEPEALPMPAEDRVRFHDEKRLSPTRDETGEAHEKPALVRGEPGFLDRPRRDDELLAQERVLGDELLYVSATHP